MAEFCPHCGAKQPAIRVAFCHACRNDVDEAPVRPGSGQEIAETLDLTIWYATETRVYAWAKLSWYDERGSIVTMPEGVRFVGPNGRGLEIRRINSVRRLTGSVIPWPAVAGLATGNVLSLLLVKLGMFDILTFDRPILLLLVLGLCSLLALSSWPMSWVRVIYLGDRNQSCSAYFTVGSSIGRWTGGMNRLNELLRRVAHTTQ
jgi:hypothetical protein